MERISLRGADDWQRLCQTAFVPLRTEASHNFAATVEVQRFLDTQVTAMTSAPTLVERPASLVLSAPRDDVLLTILTHGSGTATAGSMSALLTPGSAVMCWSGRPYILSTSVARTVTVRLPRPLVEVSDREIDVMHAQGLHDRSLEVQSLLKLLGSALAAGPCGPRRQSALERAAAALIGTIIVAGGEADWYRDSDDELYSRLCRSLDQFATDQGISLDGVAREHGTSRRKMELVFAARGTTPATYRRGVQLRQARAILERDVEARQSISSLAHIVGFGDPTAFIRAFRRAFGTSPGAWRSARQSRGPEPHDPHINRRSATNDHD